MGPRLTLLVLGLLFTTFSIVESQNHPYVASPPPPPPPPPSPPPPPPPPPTSPSSSPSPPPPPPPMTSPPPRRIHPDWRRRRHAPPPPPPPAKKMNFGKKIGLLFAGIAGVLQIGVVVFLVFKRRQLLSIMARYENCSS